MTTMISSSMNCHSTCERGRVSAANYAAGMISVTGWSCALQLAHQQHCASKNGEQNSLLDRQIPVVVRVIPAVTSVHRLEVVRQ